MAFKTSSDDISDLTFGLLTVLYRKVPDYPRSPWVCKCNCGKSRTATRAALVSGRIGSCRSLRCRLEAKLARESSNGPRQLKVKKTIEAYTHRIWEEATGAGLTDEQITECFLESFEACRRESGKWTSDLIDSELVAKSVGPRGSTMAEIMDFIRLPHKSRDRRHVLHIASVLRACGFKRWRIRGGLDAAGKRRYVPGWIGAEESKAASENHAQKQSHP